MFATPWTVAHQAPLSMEFSRQDYWSGWPFPSSGDRPDPEIKPRSPAWWADSLPSGPPGKPHLLLGTWLLLWCPVPASIPSTPHPTILLYLPGSGAREEWVQTRNLEIKISFSIYRFSCLRLIFLPLLFLSMKKGYHLIDLLWNKALLISGLIKNIYWVTIICKTLFWKLAMNKTNQDLQLPKVCHLMIDRDHNG